MTLTRSGATRGQNLITYTGRTRRGALKAGRYRMTLTAEDRAGNRSAPVTLAFKIVEGLTRRFTAPLRNGRLRRIRSPGLPAVPLSIGARMLEARPRTLVRAFIATAALALAAPPLAGAADQLNLIDKTEAGRPRHHAATIRSS